MDIPAKPCVKQRTFTATRPCHISNQLDMSKALVVSTMISQGYPAAKYAYQLLVNLPTERHRTSSESPNSVLTVGYCLWSYHLARYPPKSNRRVIHRYLQLCRLAGARGRHLADVWTTHDMWIIRSHNNNKVLVATLPQFNLDSISFSLGIPTYPHWSFSHQYFYQGHTFRTIPVQL